MVTAFIYYDADGTFPSTRRDQSVSRISLFVHHLSEVHVRFRLLVSLESFFELISCILACCTLSVPSEGRKVTFPIPLYPTRHV